MNSSEDEPSSVLNGRLRPRKSAIPSPQSIKQIVRKLDGRHAQEKPKRSSTPSKASPSKPDELSLKSDLLLTPQLLCPYCDRKFVSKQSVSKHVRRLHLSNSKLDPSIVCLFCNHVETEPNDIIRHMVDSHPNQYFACLDCHSRFPSTKELAEHKLNVCEKQKMPYRSRLRQKTSKKSQKSPDSNDDKDVYRNGTNFSGHGFNGIVISCELKPSHVHDEADIEDNITTNLILPPSKNLTCATALEKNAVIVLDDIQWNRRIPSNFSFHNTDADQILSRLGVVHRSPKTGESTKKDWFRAIEDATQKFEKCFDTRFYSKVASNVQENLSKFLDGSFNFNPDPDSTIKTRKSKNSVVINTAEGFPILLACEQYSRNVFDGYMPRSLAPKHKWKWDNLDNDKQWNPDQIKRDTHANNCIISLVSSLDIWTQLCMRRKFEDKFNITPVAKKTEKQNMIGKELKEILESREIPCAKTQMIKYVKENVPTTNEHEFPTFLGLMPSPPKIDIKPAILSGEWVRPRCYVCCACGAQAKDSRTLSAHVSSQHPNAQVQHYEIVGDSLLKADIVKHLYVPPSQNVNRTRPPRGFRDCTKCNKSVTIEDLHQHMLDCAGDTPAVRRKCRYRPFGVRRRRPRLPDNRIRKKMRNNMRTRPTRQKNRMRPRPKIRTEVGDAETIRKMLADLPAKRHRVLVNPLNSILRPRRKHEKQRAMLMMKRRTSEDQKSGKPRASNPLHFDISANNERNKNVANRDDDDNKPLKPRLKRIRITRQKESFNRKTMLSKPKRKILPLIEKKNQEVKEKEIDVSTPCPEKIQTEELSEGHSENRISLNSDPQNVREHSSDRGGSNNDRKDNQKPGCSDENGESRDTCAPNSNQSLKHSIARLTADSETHDKAVQFHHLFLIQQEYNRANNQHDPSGQPVLFENEAIVTKLDKPPLHFDQQRTLESIRAHGLETFQAHSLEAMQGHTLESIQAHHFESIQNKINKLNKPRKGLNDCIAMLKNKLVEPDPNAPAHVSVQCGSDEPIGPEPILAPPTALISPRIDTSLSLHHLNAALHTYPSTEQRSKKSSPRNKNMTEYLPRPQALYGEHHFIQEPHRNVSVERKAKHSRPANYATVASRYNDNYNKKEAARRRSVSQTENLLYAQPFYHPPPYNHETFMRLAPEAFEAYNLLPQKKTRSRQRNVKQTIAVNELPKKKTIDIQIYTESQKRPFENCERNVNIRTERAKKSLDSSEKNTRSRTSRKSLESCDKNAMIRTDNITKVALESNEKHRKRVSEIQVQRDFSLKSTEERKNVSYVTKKQRIINVNPEVNIPYLKQVEIQPVMDMNAKIPINIYTERNYNDDQLPIPPAHASSNVESILSAPLDLSGKAISNDSNYSSRHDSLLLTNYDPYETLDLSNKSRSTAESLTSEDVVVDLRVKHNSHNLQYSCSPLRSSEILRSSSSESSQHDTSSYHALNLAHRNECVPTDLSLKRNDDNFCINLSQRADVEETQIQDLSKGKTIDVHNVHNEDQFMLDTQIDLLPTDLSNKNIANTELPTSVMMTSEVNGPATSHIDYNHVNKEDFSYLPVPEDLSGKMKDANSIETITELSVTTTHVTSEEPNEKLREYIQDEDKSPDMTQLYDSENSSSQKPIYDPALRIPQFKIRPSDSGSDESNTEICPSTANSSCAETYTSNDNISIANTLSSYGSQTSTAINSSMIASIQAQERMTYSFTNPVINMAVTTLTGTLPVYTLNRGIPTPFTTYENTSPVYTLSNTCMSMSKLDGTNPTTLTNSLLSIPSTTIASTTPVYTLAGTTIVTPVNYGTLPISGHSIPYPPPCSTYVPEFDHQTMTQFASPTPINTMQEGRSDDDMGIRGGTFNFDRDNEIARNLVMLPKEIVSILAAMPIDHRNQLLDVLPQYLSTSRPIPILTTQASLFNSTGPCMLSMPSKLQRELAVDASTDTVDIKPLYSSQILDDSYQLKYNANLGTNEMVALQNQIIDLTYDDIILKTDNDIDNLNDEEVCKSLIEEENSTQNATKSNAQKPNNDKTASLRAVRIKAPSERQKSKLVINQLQDLSSSDILNISEIDNNDAERFSDADLSPNLQLFEVSSTQQLNRSTIVDGIVSQAVISPTIEQPSTSAAALNSRSEIDIEHLQDLEQIQGSALLSAISINCDVMDTTNSGEFINVDEAENSVAESSVGESSVGESSVPIPSEIPLMPNQLEEDDDSDDDISLAVIVKQKLENENKLKNATQLNQQIKRNKSKTKQNSKMKKSNKTNSVKSSLSNERNKATVSKITEKDIILGDADNVNPNINHSLDNVTLEDDQNVEVKSGHINKKIRHPTVRTEFQGTETNQKKSRETYLNKENDESFDGTNHLNVNEITAKPNKLQNIPEEIIIYSPGKKLNIQESTELSKNNVLRVEVKDVAEAQEKGELSSDNETNSVLDQSNKNENNDFETQGLFMDLNTQNINGYSKPPIDELRTTQNDEINKIDTLEKIGPESKDLTINDDLGSVKFNDNIEIRTNDAYDLDSATTSTTLKDVVNVVTNDVNSEDSGLPVRRTRRGKSLFVEGNEQPLSCSDTLLEQKAPLTKKQLIFSKLLLDEENYIKKSAGADNETVSEENNLCLNIGNQMTKSMCQAEYSGGDDKNKPIKRKKSPLPKKKFKKKKSLDSPQDIENQSSDDFPQVMEKIAYVSDNKANITETSKEAENSTLTSGGTLMAESIVTQSEKQTHTNNCDKQTTDVGEIQITKPNSIEKRKISSLTSSSEYVHSSKPKKSKLNTFKDILTTLQQDEIASVKDNHCVPNHHLPLAARRTRSKSVVVKSSSSMLYDPYDIELEDMADKTEPFRKQRLSSLKSNISKPSKVNDFNIGITHETVTTEVPEINLITTETTVANNTKETVCDSDESSKSDVPLKKYVEEKERKNSQSLEGTNSKTRHDIKDYVDFNDTDVKQSKRKHKKSKRTFEESDEVRKAQVESQEELRSEQFMESFGFFSERKPRKSNLLATKKISETFHIANESDDVYFKARDRPKKKSRSENRRSLEGENYTSRSRVAFPKISEKRIRKLDLRTEARYCHVCKKEFRRPDNLLRHQMTLIHVSNLAEFEMNISITSVPDEPNYLVVFKQHLDRLKMLQIKMKASKGTKKITLPTMQQILVDVRRAVRDQQLARRSLSRDEVLFLDCCELLKDSNRSSLGVRTINRPIISCCPNSYALACASALSQAQAKPPSDVNYTFSASNSRLPKRPVIHTSARLSGMENFVPINKRTASNTDPYAIPSTSSAVPPYISNGFVQASSDTTIIEENPDDKSDSKSDGDVDSITAQNILNSEEVRNLENDLISGLKETCKFQPILTDDKILSKNEHDNLTEDNVAEVNYIQMDMDKPAENEANLKEKKDSEIKDKNNLDINIGNINIFEDKFDKIKRKCRSQAAAAKHVQTVVEPRISHKSRKKSEKKKGKKSSKKYNQNTVLTKGALKGYDSIKVSILTSDINMSAIVPPIVTSSKKKKKSSSKKKKDRKNSLLTHKYDSNRTKESPQKNVDVYEFMENEEPEIFELRPSTVMERFRNMNNKEPIPNTSKAEVREEVESNDSLSDEDDFVYMSDDYVGCDEETENTLTSFDKPSSPLKRKDAMEKNAVMGKIFKNNAVRSGKKIKSRDRTPPPPANLDQLFDSLLEDEPNSSMLLNDPESPNKENYTAPKKRVFSPVELSKYDLNTTKNNNFISKKIRTPSPALSSDSAVSKRIHSLSSRESSPRRLSPSRYDAASTFDYGPSTSNRYGETSEYLKYSSGYRHSLSRKFEFKKKYDTSVSKSMTINDDLSLSPKSNELTYDTYPKMKTNKVKSPTRKKEKPTNSHVGYDYKVDCYDQDTFSDDAGVARQRARRKCTVGKQNVLAETWSSESEPDGIPPRPNSAESVVLSAARKRKGRKKEGQTCGSRKNKQVSFKKQEIESRVSSTNRVFGASGGGAGSSRSGGGGGPSVSAYSHTLSLPGPSGMAPRVRPTSSFWADGDEEQEHVQQHGWIVGDSHKKLVTMLAHAKGRKRNNDDKRHMIE
ncbi:uncharacterized protein [Epargyreus clarus]|uniref:uncharacterized protein n=1 Tax=Epargyreus clarus TaxID=520877 RepID=UPI003C303A48